MFIAEWRASFAAMIPGATFVVAASGTHIVQEIGDSLAQQILRRNFGEDRNIRGPAASVTLCWLWPTPT